MKSMSFALIPLSDTAPASDLPSPVLLRLQTPIKQVALSVKSVFIVMDSGEVSTSAALENWSLRPLSLPIVVRSVACNEEVCFTVSEVGKVFVWGTDKRESGVMGIPGLYASERPMSLDDLVNAEIVQVSVGVTHAAALDSTIYIELGHLYAWGSGTYGELCGSSFSEQRIMPRLVEGTRIFTVKKVLCGIYSTSICTGGGFVYVFGEYRSHRSLHTPLSSGKQQNQPKAPAQFGDIYASDICLGPTYLALLTEAGQVFCFDDCLELALMPAVSDAKVQSIGSTNRGLFGLSSKCYTESGGLLQEWTQSWMHWNQSYLLDILARAEKMPCSLQSWKGLLYLLDEPWDSASSVIWSKGDFICLQMTQPPQGSSTSTCGQQISETIQPKLNEFTLKLMGSLNLSYDMDPQSPALQAGIQTPASISMSLCENGEEVGSMEDQKAFERVLRSRVGEEQKERLKRSLESLLISRLNSAVSEMREFGLRRERDRRLHATLNALSAIAELKDKLMRARLSFGFSSLKQYSSILSYANISRQQEESYAKMSKEESAKLLFRVLSRVSSAYIRAVEGHFLKQMEQVRNAHQHLTSLISRLMKHLNTGLVFEQRLAVKQWRNVVMLQAMKDWGLGKLVKQLTRFRTNQAWNQLLRWSQRKMQLRSTFEKVLKRRTRDSRREAFGRCFSVWKSVSYQWAMQRSSHLQAMQVSIKALSHVVRRLLRSCVYSEALERMRSYALHRQKTANLRHPLLFFSSIYDKIHTRTFSWAFNNLIRFNPETAKSWRKQCIKALVRMSVSIIRKAFWDVIDHASALHQQIAIDFTFRLQRVLDRMQQRSMAWAWSRLDVVINTMSQPSLRYPEEENSLVVLGDSQEVHMENVTRLSANFFAAMKPQLTTAESMEFLTSRSNYYSPEETASFLTKEAEPGDGIGKPLELDSPLSSVQSKDIPPSGRNPRFVKKRVNSMKGNSPINTGDTRPPWRVPSLSGVLSTKPSSKNSHLRRKMYENVLKERQARSRFNQGFPMDSEMSPVPKVKGLIELTKTRSDRVLSQCERNLSNASTERREWNREVNLKAVLVAKNIGKVVSRVHIHAWNLMKLWVAQGDGFHATLGQADFVSTFPLKQEKQHVRRASQNSEDVLEQHQDLPDDKELEVSWKSRLVKVGSQRLVRVVDPLVQSLLALAFQAVQNYQM